MIADRGPRAAGPALVERPHHVGAVVTHGHERLLDAAVGTDLAEADVGHERIAEALAALELGLLAALAQVVGPRLRGAAVPDNAVLALSRRCAGTRGRTPAHATS